MSALNPPLEAAPTDGQPKKPGGHDIPHVVVLGAGVCGLYAARTLAGAGVRVTVLEKEMEVGGLAAGNLRNGNYYDLGVHMLHEFDHEIYDDIRQMMGDRMLDVELSAKIRYGKAFYRYPLEPGNLIRGIPPLTLIGAVSGLFWQQLRNRFWSSPPRDAEEALVQLYGRPLYNFFFRDFTHRYWGIKPHKLSATFVKSKMPRLSAVDFLKKLLSKVGLADKHTHAVESALSEETLHYSRKGAYEMPHALADYVRAHGGEVIVNCHVKAVQAIGGRVTAVDYMVGDTGRTLTCDYCISTIPVPHLIRELAPPAPEVVQTAAKQLRFKPLAVYGLLVNREKVLDALYIYYRNRVFHRVGEPKNAGLQVTPSDHTVLIVEMTCEIGDEKWNGSDEVKRRIVEDLAAEKIIEAGEVVETHLLRHPTGYPVFELGFEPHLKAVQDHIATFTNLSSVGRQGGFCYPNMHSAMRMGADAAKRIIALRTSPAASA